ncbi:hypothetical protein T265_07621 [Opisthorchis viverrini]|uniref:Uncharacterized protein n=1 Tax=Opisthorchis viverrini TaxID=6198 RepID=A0A074ZGK9_OPIVI|nr:hypothetical protein T265_07621 [Opisthorchis viverrini]KER24792.1 hypothetical protein T265_07621 [Opisthorchis viverrini]
MPCHQEARGLGYCKVAQAQTGEIKRQRPGSNHGPSGFVPSQLLCHQVFGWSWVCYTQVSVTASTNGVESHTGEQI